MLDSVVPTPLLKPRTQLRLYGWIFAASGAVFVLGGARLFSLLSLAAPFLPGARPFEGGGPSLWLGLTGSLMAMVAALSFVLARDPSRGVAWNTLLLSKGASALLFAAFAASEKNSLFLLGAAVDGSIFIHLACLRRALETAADPLAARLPGAAGPFYEVWFAKFNDPESRRALWLRYEALRADKGGEASCGWVLFEPDGRIRSGKWALPLDDAAWGRNSPFRLGESAVLPGRLVGRRGETAWDFTWEDGPAPEFRFVPGLLAATGLAGSDYVTPVSFGRFSGALRLDGEEIAFRGVPGCLGHIWGRNMADNWRWAHAVLEGPGGKPAVFEILSAQVRLGPWRSPRLTCAHLWLDGTHRASVGLARALSNATAGDASGWSFRAGFGDITVSGECAPGPTAQLEYESPDGRRLLCRNSKTGRLTLRAGGRTLSTSDAAAVEWVEPAP